MKATVVYNGKSVGHETSSTIRGELHGIEKSFSKQNIL